MHAEDSGEHWYTTIGPERSETSRSGDEADLTLTGSAANLYLLLWNRTAGSNISMSGNTDLMDLWYGNFGVQWP
ncbi:MAG: hypothetical protein KJN63_02930 [Acidimicrobiia bacterium]|nr:hypothetical protein [Acidimicrobiia bacterium]